MQKNKRGKKEGKSSFLGSCFPFMGFRKTTESSEDDSEDTYEEQGSTSNRQHDPTPDFRAASSQVLQSSTLHSFWPSSVAREEFARRNNLSNFHNVCSQQGEPNKNGAHGYGLHWLSYFYVHFLNFI